MAPKEPRFPISDVGVGIAGIEGVRGEDALGLGKTAVWVGAPELEVVGLEGAGVEEIWLGEVTKVVQLGRSSRAGRETSKNITKKGILILL